MRVNDYFLDLSGSITDRTSKRKRRAFFHLCRKFSPHGLFGVGKHASYNFVTIMPLQHLGQSGIILLTLLFWNNQPSVDVSLLEVEGSNDIADPQRCFFLTLSTHQQEGGLIGLIFLQSPIDIFLLRMK